MDSDALYNDFPDPFLDKLRTFITFRNDSYLHKSAKNAGQKYLEKDNPPPIRNYYFT
jgi:hypothetical protein